MRTGGCFDLKSYQLGLPRGAIQIVTIQHDRTSSIQLLSVHTITDFLNVKYKPTLDAKGHSLRSKISELTSVEDKISQEEEDSTRLQCDLGR
jgi:hypothetical protein